MKKNLLLVIAVLFAISLNAQTSNEIVVKGEQSKGPGYTNATLKCDAVTINQTMYIVKVEGNSDFWVQDSKGNKKTFDNASQAKNYELKPDTYYFYPNPPSGKSGVDSWHTSVTVTLNTSRK